jgi:ribosome maturation factor RimP
MVKSLEEKLKELVEEKLSQPGFESYFLVEIQQNNTKVEVFLDADAGVDFGVCKKISRHLESWIDESGALGESYTLDVSSAGVGRPLLLTRQFKKNEGRDLELKLLNGTSVIGLLLKATDDSITIEQEIKVKEGNKNIKKKIQQDIAYAEISKAIVKIRF